MKKAEFDFIKALMSGSPIYLNTIVPFTNISNIVISRIPDPFDNWRNITISTASGEIQRCRVSPTGKIRNDKNAFLGVFTIENEHFRYTVFAMGSKQKYEALKIEFPEVSVRAFPTLGPDGTTYCFNVSNIIQIK
jgi:hypothetical protein|nr:MAG TPA: hypothetical protein [Caudoviricetes sp.]